MASKDLIQKAQEQTSALASAGGGGSPAIACRHLALKSDGFWSMSVHVTTVFLFLPGKQLPENQADAQAILKALVEVLRGSRRSQTVKLRPLGSVRHTEAFPFNKIQQLELLSRLGNISSH